MDNISKTIQFLIETFEGSSYFKDKQDQKRYRIEHTFRVANIGREIAQAENMNIEALVIACLLHDIGYATMSDNWQNHGRESATIARSFLNTLNMSPDLIEEICFGIAIHVDGVADFEGKETAFAASISDADNIDRFDVYRIYEGLQYQKFDTFTLDDKKDFVEKKIRSLKKYLDWKMATDIATKLWLEKINYQIGYFELMMKQLGNSSEVNL